MTVRPDNSLPFASFVLAMEASTSFAQSTDKPVVVIVHRTFADGSDLANVIPLLQAKCVNVVAVQNSLTSLADDVAATQRAIDAQPGRVVLVGLSWGGVVITQAGDDLKVSALAYVAALAPDVVRPVASLAKPSCPHPALRIFLLVVPAIQK